MNLPTINIVVAHYNEPIPHLRRTISRIKSELTWADVKVIVYHQGIPGFGQIGARSDLVARPYPQAVRKITEQLREDCGADVVVPRENTGRDMGAYLQHMSVRAA
jgi:hypothetical protein